MGEAVARVLERLENVRKSGQGWSARCPAHDDRHNSLSVNEGVGGKALLHCHAGCQQDEVVESIGFRVSDLFIRGESGMAHNGRHSGRAIEAEYDYVDENGELLFQAVRFEPKDFRQRSPDGRGGWTWSLNGVRRVLYRLPDVRAKAAEGGIVFVVEGEKDADRLAGLGFTATTCAGGAGKWREEYAESLRGARVVIVPDNDEPGRKHAHHVACALWDVASEIRIIELPDLPEKGDVSDWIDAGGAANGLKQLVQATPPMTAPPGAPSGEPTDDDAEEEAAGSVVSTGGAKPTQAERLLSLAKDAVLWRTSDSTAYASFVVRGHREHWPVRSGSFRRWLLRRFYQAEAKPPGSQAVQDAIGVLEARAEFDGAEYDVFVRVGGSEGHIYLDLCDDDWRAVRVGPDGWDVVDNPPIRFGRRAGMAALPAPSRDGAVSDLRPFVNIADDRAFRLFLAALAAYLRPSGPYPVIVLQGEQGSAKSTTARVARALIDPSTAPLRTTPREERDLMIAARNGWILAFDNLSGVRTWFSDALCRLATGGGFTTRALYTDDEEVIFEAQRPVLLNGIEEIADRDDLRDRAVFITLPPIPDDHRRPEDEFWSEFEAARPRILGALLDAVSVALRELPSTHLAQMPRMADFARWATAAESGFGWPTHTFMEDYQENLEAAVDLSIEQNPVAQVVVTLAEDREFEGTATELLQLLDGRVADSQRGRKAWPNSPQALSNKLRRAATSLRALGVEVEFDRDGGGRRRTIRIHRLRRYEPEKVRKSPSRSSQASQTAEVRDKLRDATCDACDDVVEVASQVASHGKPHGSALCDDCDACDATSRALSGPSGEGGEDVGLLDLLAPEGRDRGAL